MHAALLFLAGAVGALVPESSPVVLPLRFVLEVPLPEEATAELRSEVETIFAPGGIQLEWRAEAQTAVAVVELAPEPTLPVVTGCSRDLHDHRLAVADLGTRRITVWTSQVARAIRGAWDAPAPPSIADDVHGRALGRVLAHELGHVLLRLDGHQRQGLMRKTFKHRELSASRGGRFRLARGDLEKIRHYLERRRLSPSSGDPRASPEGKAHP